MPCATLQHRNNYIVSINWAHSGHWQLYSFTIMTVLVCGQEVEWIFGFSRERKKEIIIYNLLQRRLHNCIIYIAGNVPIVCLWKK